MKNRHDYKYWKCSTFYKYNIEWSRNELRWGLASTFWNLNFFLRCSGGSVPDEEMLGQEQADGRSQACQRHARVIGSGLIVFGSTKFDEYGSGSSSIKSPN